MQEINDDDDVYDVYFSLADVMWKKGRLTENILNKALELIPLEEQSGRWEKQGLHKSRHKVLMKLQEELLSEMPPRKKIPIHKPYKIGWEAGDVYTFKIKNPPDGYEEYKDWYALLYIDKIVIEDWNVRSVNDEVAEMYAFLIKDKPSDVTVINKATRICFMEGGKSGNVYRVKLLEASKRERPKDIEFIGKFSEFKYPEKEHRQINLFFWLLYERDILWGYEKQLRLEKEQKDSL